MTTEAFGETITLSVQVLGLALLYAGLIVEAVWRSSLATKTKLRADLERAQSDNVKAHAAITGNIRTVHDA